MEDFEVCIDDTKYTISDVMKWAKELKVSYKELLEKLECWYNYHWAVFAYMDCNPDWIEDINQLDFSDNFIHIGNFHLLVADEYDADKLHYERCSALVDDEIPEYLSSYFDYDSFADDQNRGEMLATWDRIEHSYCVDDEWIYVYRN